MAKVIALHTIHRRHPTRKGEQEVIAPDTEFESSGAELESLEKQGAVKVLDKKAQTQKSTAKKATAGKAATTKAAEKPADKEDEKDPASEKEGDEDLGDL